MIPPPPVETTAATSTVLRKPGFGAGPHAAVHRLPGGELMGRPWPRLSSLPIPVMSIVPRPVLSSPLGELSEPTAELFETAAREDFFQSLPWFRTLASHGFAPGGAFRVSVSGKAGARGGLVTEALRGSALAPRTLRGLTNFYSCRFAPLLEDPARVEAIGHLVAALTAERPAWDVINLDSLDHDGPVFAALTDAFARHGWPVQRYFHFGNWYEDTTGMTAADYFAARPGNLRSTLKRQGTKLQKTANAAFQIFRAPGETEEAIRLYEQVYAQSWKLSEPFPSFAAALIRTTADLGCLRLGILTMDQEPVAAQIWIVWHGKATIFKLAHDQRHTALSPGSLLTRHVMEHVLGEGGINEVDFGRGDDPYKQLWLPKRRERWGIMAFNPRTPRGGMAAARHLGAAAARRMVAGIRQRFKCA